MEKKQIAIPGLLVPTDVAKYLCGYLFGLSINKEMTPVFRMYIETKYKHIHSMLPAADQKEINEIAEQLKNNNVKTHG